MYVFVCMWAFIVSHECVVVVIDIVAIITYRHGVYWCGLHEKCRRAAG